ncbi:DMT family transporter [Iodidimonas sp. SYSU 1G8]|uniref:DMT family transporter n=1 Tax=Iodidimonas sp. SYSU 1G8 TaxID=3133967 RepID=UPI0031FE9F42
MPTFARLSRTAQAVVFMICASATISLLWAALRVGSETMHPIYMVFWRSFLGAVVLLPLLMRTGIGSLRTRRLPLHTLRSLCSLTAMVGIFYSIAHVPLAQGMAINYSAPLFATLGAALLLGETLHQRRVVALLIGFAGMLLVVRPGFQEVHLGILAALVGALGMASALLCVKKLSATESTPTIIFYGNTLCLPIGLLLALNHWQPMTWHNFGVLAVIGVLSTTAQTFLTRALTLADAGAVLPMDFLRLVFVTLLGVMLFDETPDALTWAGAGLILASTVYIARREARQRKAAATAPKAAE